MEGNIYCPKMPKIIYNVTLFTNVTLYRTMYMKDEIIYIRRLLRGHNSFGL